MHPHERILAELYDREGAYCSMQELARRTGLDRGTLAEHLQTLGERGYRLDADPAYGVRWERPVKLAGCLIERDLGTRRLGGSVICFDEVDSTNAVALQASRQADADGLVILAEAQRAGRGRQGRRWLARPGQNVLMSVVVPLADSGALAAAGPLTIAAGLAVADAVRTVARVQSSLKWPNDVLIDGRKLAGVLVEVAPDSPRPRAVVGLGVNANHAPPDSDVDRPATSLAEHTGQPVERVELVREILRNLDGWLDSLDAPAGVARLREAFLARCEMINQRVRARVGGRTYVGRVMDVDPLEGLTLACDSGTTVRLAAATTSLLDGRGD